MRVRYVETFRTNTVTTTHGKRTIDEKRYREAEVNTLDELVEIRAQHFGDQNFRFDPPLERIIDKAATNPGGKRCVGRRPKNAGPRGLNENLRMWH